MKEGVENKLKFKKLKRRLGFAEWQVVGILESIWKLTRTSAPAGDIGRHSNEDIAAAIEYEGDPDALITSLVECGWFDEDEEFRLIVHDWSDHVPTYLKGNFAKHNKTFANEVAKQRAKQPAKQRANSTLLPSQAKPSTVKPSQDLGAQPSAASPDEVVFEFPCSGKSGGDTFCLRASKLAEYTECYPGMDVAAEVRKARQWCIDNPSKRKTVRGMTKFLGNWLARSQDTGRASVKTAKNPQSVWPRIVKWICARDQWTPWHEDFEAEFGKELLTIACEADLWRIRDADEYELSALQRQFNGMMS